MKLRCVKCGHQETLVNGEEVSSEDRCPHCGTVGTLDTDFPKNEETLTPTHL